MASCGKCGGKWGYGPICNSCWGNRSAGSDSPFQYGKSHYSYEIDRIEKSNENTILNFTANNSKIIITNRRIVVGLLHYDLRKVLSVRKYYPLDQGPLKNLFRPDKGGMGILLMPHRDHNPSRMEELIFRHKDPTIVDTVFQKIIEATVIHRYEIR